MTIILIILAAAVAIPDQFTPVEGFMDLDNSATPTRFGLLLVAGEDSASNLRMAELILATMDSLPEDAFPDLYVITMDESGYPDIAALCGEYEGYPTTLIMVGHCGYIEMDPCFLTAEIIDAWYTWGSPDSRKTGICNFCRRCNP
ncbi:MAG: hypothetical protein KAT09_05720 [Candidatus Aegiribacteria sp.]|nr:hypothetical protein [Candidatus Aegiribacteria sp.]